MKRTCYNCAYIRESHFKKYSSRAHITGEKRSPNPNYHRVIYWCKKGPQRNPNERSINFKGCDKHETKAERRVINDKIKEKIYQGTAAKRIKDKVW